MPEPETLPVDRRDVRLLVEAVREAGALALTLFRQRVRNWTKPDGTPVTEADLAVDALLRTRLQTQRPSYGWLSEESPESPDRRNARTIWIADPIDGTRSFVNGSDEWCIAVALVHDRRPVCGVVYRPVTEQLYEASLGAGAVLNGKSIAAGLHPALDCAMVVGSRGALRSLARHGCVEPQIGTDIPLALRLCLVAQGAYDAAVSTGNKNDWDLAAGDLILHEAGGTVTGLDGKLYAYNGQKTWQRGMVAANLALHRMIVSAMGD